MLPIPRSCAGLLQSWGVHRVLATNSCGVFVRVDLGVVAREGVVTSGDRRRG